jgi:hypothetical protein
MFFEARKKNPERLTAYTLYIMQDGIPSLVGFVGTNPLAVVFLPNSLLNLRMETGNQDEGAHS